MLVSVAACAPGTDVRTTQTGVVVAVDGQSAAEVTSVTIRGDDGRVTDHDVGTLELSGGGLPAAHLREHLVSGIPIRYTTLNGVLIHYLDAE